jgi:hypothetical protein
VIPVRHVTGSAWNPTGNNHIVRHVRSVEVGVVDREGDWPDGERHHDPVASDHGQVS